MLYVQRHLPNRLEYKVLSCITVHYQSRMASSEIAGTPSRPSTVQAGQWYYLRLICGGGRGVLGDVVGAAAWGSKISTFSWCSVSSTKMLKTVH